MVLANNSGYLGYPILVDAQDLMQRAFTYLKNKIPSWEPSEGQLDVWMIETIASEAADIGTLASQVPLSIFRYFGANLMGIQPIDATSATTTIKFNLSDVLGHTIPAGSQVGIRNITGDLIAFITLNELVIPAGSDEGNAVISAIIPGAAASGLGTISGPVELIDVFSWVDNITQYTVTTGGLDAESDDTYLSRLALELQTMAPRPILPRDFAILARNVPGVQRAVAIDGYNPDDETDDNERMVTIVALDSSGNPVSSDIKTDISDYLEQLREINFVVNMMDAVIIQIDITAVYTILSGYNSGDVADRVSSAINGYIDPATWGIDSTDDPNDPITFINRDTIYYLELATVINNVVGVDRITTLTLGLHGDSQAATDLVLDAIVPIPTIETLSSTPF